MIQEWIEHTVTADQAPFSYLGNCYQEGAVISMHPFDYAKMCGITPTVDAKQGNPWPKWELICGAPRPVTGNTYAIEPKEWVCIDIDAFPCRPDVLELNYKGDCIQTLCDQVPVPDSMEEHKDWNGPQLNERTFLLSEDPVTCKKPGKFYIYNPGPDKITVFAALYQL